VLAAAHAEQLPLKSFRTTDGLLTDSINSIVQDSRGFLWFGTSFGLSRFDGYGFTHYTEKDGLSYPNVNGLIETRDGSYWICTNGGGVFRFHPNGEPGSRFNVYPVGDQAATNRVNNLYEDRGGRIWAGTDAGLFRLERDGAGKFLPVALGVPAHPEQEVQVWGFVEDGEGSLWISTKFGLVRRLADGRMLHYSVQPLASGRDLVRAILLDHEGRLWVGHESWLVIFKPLPAVGTPSAVRRPQSAIRDFQKQFPWRRLQNGGALEGKVTLPAVAGEALLYRVAPRVFCQSADRNIWIGTEEHGLMEFDGARFRRFTTAHGLGGNTIAPNTLIEARDGDLWFSVAGSGAMRMSRSGFVTYTESDGLGDNRIGTIFEDQAGELYVITARWQVNHLERRPEGIRFNSVRLNLPPRITNEMWRPFRQIIRDHTGEWWVGTTEGLYRFPKVERIEQLGRVRPKAVYTARDGLVSDDVTYLFEDSRGDVWIGTFAPAREILTRWERATGKFQRYSDSDGLRPFNATLRFQEDVEGQVWVSFREGGLARYTASRFKLFDTSDGLPAGPINSIHRDQAGRLSITSSTGGLARIDEPQSEHPHFTAYTQGIGVLSARYLLLTEDSEGRIYFGTPFGVERLDPATGRIKQYTPDDGLAAVSPQVALRDREGTLWFGAIKGLSRLIPPPDRVELPPPIFIGGLRIAGQTYPVSDFGQTEVSSLELEPSQNQMNIDFFGLDLTLGEPLRYQYKLEGAGKDWSPPTAQRTVELSLGPGSYRFLVRAMRADGTLSETPAVVGFKILRPIWQRWWFLSFLVFLVCSAVFAFDRYRVARTKELRAALDKSRTLTSELTDQRSELRRANKTLELEFAIIRVLAESTTPAEAAPGMLQVICEDQGWEMGAIWDVAQPGNVLRCLNVWHRPELKASEFEALTRKRTFVPGEGLPGRVLASGQAHWIAELTDDTNFPRLGVAAREGLHSGFGFPILLRGQVIGVMEFFSRAPREPDADQTRIMSAIGSQLGQLIQRKWAEEALRESENRYRTLAGAASDAIITIDEASRIVLVNDAAEKIFGYSTGEMLGAELTMLMPEYLRHLHQTGLARYKETGKRHISWAAIELPGLRKDGREIPLELSFGEFIKDDKRYFTGIARDITERKLAEEALRRSREERFAELERVRRRIAADLHDDIGSSLTQISLLSEVMRTRVDRDDSRLTGPLSMIAGASRELVDSISDIVWAINPQKDHLSDLTLRMRRFASDVFTARNILFRLSEPDEEQDVQLGANIRREIFLIFKESVNNVVRHSGCIEAQIEFQVAEQYLVLKVADDGKGFDSSASANGHGLTSMRKRAQDIGGRLEITSNGGKGTTVSLKVPLGRSLEKSYEGS